MNGFSLLAAASNKEAMNHFVVIIVALAVILIIVLILGSRKSGFRKFMAWMFEEDPSSTQHQNYMNGMKKNTRVPRTELVMLVQKVDERKRIVDARGHSRLFNEYYELIFRTRKGEAIHIITDKNTFRQVPFNQQGSLTFMYDEFVRFKSVNGVIEKAEK